MRKDAHTCSLELGLPRAASLLIATIAVLLPAQAKANPDQETRESDFLELVHTKNNVLVQGRGVDDVNAKARARNLRFLPSANSLLKGTAL